MHEANVLSTAETLQLKKHAIGKFSGVFQKALGLSDEQVELLGTNVLVLPMEKFCFIFQSALKLTDSEMAVVMKGMDSKHTKSISLHAFADFLCNEHVAQILGERVGVIRPREPLKSKDSHSKSATRKTISAGNHKMSAASIAFGPNSIEANMDVFNRPEPVKEARHMPKFACDEMMLATTLGEGTLSPIVDREKATLNSETVLGYDKFAKVETEGEIHVEMHLSQLIDYLGFLCTQEEVLHFATNNYDFRFSTMNKSEAVKFVKAYDAHRLLQLREAYNDVVAAKGEVRSEDIVNLILAHPSTSDIEEAAITSLLIEITTNPTIKWDNLAVLIEKLRKQRGFSDREILQFGQSFAKFQGPDKLVNVDDMREVFTWIGRPFIELDYGDVFGLDQLELLNSMMHYRREFKQLAIDVYNQWSSVDRGMPMQLLPHALELMDYSLRADVILEALADIGIRCSIQDIVASVDVEGPKLMLEPWQALLAKLHEKETFNWDELESIRSAFDTYVAKHGSAPKTISTVVDIFRMIGLYDMQTSTISMIEAEIKRTQRSFEVYQIKTFLRFHNLFFQRRLMNGFSWHASTELPRSLPANYLEPVLRMSGLSSPTKKVIDQALRWIFPDSSGGIPYLFLLQISDHAQKAMFPLLKKNRGFPEDEVKRYQFMFQQADLMGTSGLNLPESRIMFLNLFPAEKSKTYDELLSKTPLRHKKCLIFEDMLDLLRMYEDWKDRLLHDNENKVIASTSFSEMQVEELRSCYIAIGVNTKKSLDVDAFMQFSSQIFRVPPENESKKIREILVKSKSFSLNFAQFLILMKKLIDEELVSFHTRKDTPGSCLPQENTR